MRLLKLFKIIGKLTIRVFPDARTRPQTVRKLFHGSSLLSLFITVYMLLGAENAGPQTSNGVDAAAAEGLKTVHRIDDKVQRIHSTREGVHNRPIDVDDERNTVPDTGSRIIDGAQVILNISSMPS